MKVKKIAITNPTKFISVALLKSKIRSLRATAIRTTLCKRYSVQPLGVSGEMQRLNDEVSFICKMAG